MLGKVVLTFEQKSSSKVGIIRSSRLPEDTLSLTLIFLPSKGLILAYCLNLLPT